MNHQASKHGNSGNPLSIPAAQLLQVGKCYRLGNEERWVVRNIDFQVHDGEIVMLVGPSGSGKSTLLSMLGCLLTPDEGMVTIRGQNATGSSLAELAALRRQHIGFIFQKFQLIRGLNAAENVAVPLTFHGYPLRQALAKAEEYLNRVGLWDYRHASPSRMSPGQCQRIAVARALVNSPDLVLADEPTASLDSQSGQDAMNLLQSLVKESGVAAVVVTHDSRIHGYADRVHRVNNGKLGPAMLGEKHSTKSHSPDSAKSYTVFPQINLGIGVHPIVGEHS